VTTLLKFIHLAAIAIWSGGLIVLPYLFWQRRGLAAGTELDRLHRITRLVFVELTSPAAFVAIASGTVLIFLQATFVEWFTAKMVFVGIMAMLHVLAGLVLHDLYLPDGRFSRTSAIALTIAYLIVIVAIIWIVLAKPNIDSNLFVPHLFEPGGLGRWLHHSFGETRIPTP
jgi:protoporphyrinogen IX oxidase